MKNLVLIPALMCDARFYAAQKREMSDIAKIIVADHTQHEDIEELAASLLDKLPDRFALAGTSMGGYVALEMVRQLRDAGDEERVTQLCLIGTRANIDTPEQKEAREDQTARALEGEFNEIYGSLMRSLVHEERLSQKSFMQSLYDMGRSLGVDVFVRQQKLIMSRRDCSFLLPQIKSKSLVICGRQDKVTPLDIHQDMSEELPNCNLIIVERCGHLVPFEQPSAVTDALRYWLVGDEPYRRPRKQE